MNEISVVVSWSTARGEHQKTPFRHAERGFFPGVQQYRLSDRPGIFRIPICSICPINPIA